MSTVRADNFANRLGTSSIPADTLLQGTAKAWINLNGTGTIAIRDSFNVSSVVDNNTGDYTANFSTAFPNVNFAAVSSMGDPTFVGSTSIPFGRGWTVSSHRIIFYIPGGAANDVGAWSGSMLGDPV